MELRVAGAHRQPLLDVPDRGWQLPVGVVMMFDHAEVGGVRLDKLTPLLLSTTIAKLARDGMGARHRVAASRR